MNESRQLCILCKRTVETDKYWCSSAASQTAALYWSPRVLFYWGHNVGGDMERRHDILRGYPKLATRMQKKRKKYKSINKHKQGNKQTNKEMKRLCLLFIWVECIKFTYLIVVAIFSIKAHSLSWSLPQFFMAQCKCILILLPAIIKT